MNGFERRSVAYRAPFSVKKMEGRNPSYNIVDKNGLGVASFGIDEVAASIFCESANEFSQRILDEHRA